MCVCMYLRMYVHMYDCMYDFLICVRMYTCVSESKYVHACMQRHVQVCLCMLSVFFILSI